MVNASAYTKSLIHHGIRNFEESADVGAIDIVARRPKPVGAFHAGGMDALHDEVQTIIDFLLRPGEPHAVLCHFEAGYRNAARIGRLSRTVQDLGIEEEPHAFEMGRHVRALANHVNAVLQEIPGVLRVDLVLGCARECAVCLVIPQRIVVFGAVDRCVHGLGYFSA